jgi:hypothetical protein
MYVIYTNQVKDKITAKPYFYTAKTGNIWSELICDALQYDKLDEARIIAACLLNRAFYMEYNEIVKSEHNRKLLANKYKRNDYDYSCFC